MSAGLFSPGINFALDRLVMGGLRVAILRVWPPAGAVVIAQLIVVPPAMFGAGEHPLVEEWEAAVVDGIACRRNTKPVALGELRDTVQDAVGWVLFDRYDRTIAWGPFVNSSGAETVRSFEAGDELQFPAGALRIGLV